MSNGVSIAAVKSPSSPVDWVKVVLSLALAALVYVAYCVTRMGGPLFSPYTWLVQHWGSVSNYSHGPLIPFIASFLMWWNLSRERQTDAAAWKPYWVAVGCGAVAFMLPDLAQMISQQLHNQVYRVVLFAAPFLLAWQVWAVRAQLAALQEPPIRAGVAVVAIAMLFYYGGIKAAEAHTVVFSFVLLLYGLVLSLGGRKLFRMLFFPITFLFLMIPLNFMDEFVGFPLRLYVAQASTTLLNWFGIETTRVRTGIYSSVFRFDVADPCSGIRSLMALTTVTAAYAYVTQQTQWKRWVLFLSAVPLAVLGNMARVTSIALVAHVYGQDLASKTYHEYSGYIVFGVALSTMVVLGLLLNIPYRQLWEGWMKPPDQKPIIDD